MENIKFEDVITSLEQTRTDLQKQKEKADAFKRDAQKLKEDTANTNRLLKDKTDKIIERARMEAKQILDNLIIFGMVDMINSDWNKIHGLIQKLSK